MNNEIKEILDSLNKIANAEYLLTYRECKQLSDYITGLRQEIERLNNIINKLKKNKRIREHNSGKIMPPPFEYRGYFTNKKIG